MLVSCLKKTKKNKTIATINQKSDILVDFSIRTVSQRQQQILTDVIPHVNNN